MSEQQTTILGGGIEIDLGALVRNWQALDKVSGKALTAAVVKGDAYGTGIKTVGRTLYHAGARFFFVATPDEGVLLRKAVPGAFIFVLDGLVPRTAADYAAHNLMPVLASMSQLTEWLDFCLNRGEATPAALHFDTGFNRVGFRMQEADLVKRELDQSGFQPQMIMSHLACADQPTHEMTRKQNGLFQGILNRFPDTPASLANSAGLMASKDYHYHMVRPGIAVYGGKAINGRPNPMAPVFSMQVPILQIKEARIGETVGYGAAYRLRRDSRLAIMALGYADGYFRALSGIGGQQGGRVAVNGTVVPVLGRVSMDMTAIDITDVPGLVQPGDLVEIVGPNIAIDDIGDAARTIGYEILTTLNGRFPRRYVNVPEGIEVD
ncbi:alanine racemase [Pelagibacterium lentulum]|uniref:Alanine racemase n=1 Tax=Pelagibacterium lentulum TaxID=2029865 RepID=A0A916RCP1_9HYPH|nr:alanine racemase [Pelagibacterium lentulum]GGA50310.1 alanine racemase, biosynthetic [Pelagibacterium lentulum]